MLKRKIDDWLLEWKSREHYPLLLEGARQTGKTTSIIQFGKKYDIFFNLNFIVDETADSIFAGNLDAKTIEANILVHFHQKKPEGTVLLLLDEVQNCPRAIQALKFLALESEWDIIATGSEQGIQFNHPEISWPVGYIEYKKMNGLDFEEFLWALEIPEFSIDLVKKHMHKRTPIPEAIHKEFMRSVRKYLIIGGMPEVVQAFVDTGDYTHIFSMQARMLESYMIDIARFAEADIKLKAQLCYKSIAHQLDKQNHKFQYKIVQRNGRARMFDNAVNWLETARICTIVTNVSVMEYPTQSYQDLSDFRLYPTEIGMLMAMYTDETKAALYNDGQPEEVSASPILKTVKGGIYESLAADMLFKAGFEELSFYKRANRELEIEFVLNGSTGVVPIEIKAGRAKSKSLDRLLEEQAEIHGFKFGSQNIGVSKNKTTMPIYLLPFIREIILPAVHFVDRDDIRPVYPMA